MALSAEYKMGRKAAQATRDAWLAVGGERPMPRIFLDQDEVWPSAGPYTWSQYVKGAKSVLGEHRVIGGGAKVMAGSDGPTPKWLFG